MKANLLLRFGAGLSLMMVGSIATAQISFTTATGRFTNTNVHSGCPTTIIDWNEDGLDDVVRLDQGRYIYVEIQKPGAQFESRYFGDIGGSNGWAWAMAVTDVDDNGYKDVIAGGYGPAVKIAKMNATGMTATIVNLPSSNFFLQNLTIADINNDGAIDIFCCDDNAESHIYLNDGAGNFSTSTIIDFDVTATDDSGNYGSVWTDYDNDGDLDLYIAKCRQAISNPADGRRINVMFRNNGDGTFTEAAAASNINVGWQSWTAAFGDIDNDNDFDLLLTNHDYESQIWENDGNGVYTDITASTGFTLSVTPIESVFEDFDNDGFVDIFITGADERLFRNNGNSTFSLVTGIFNSDDMESFSIGDVNHDGFIDVYASYANIYTDPSTIQDELWLNDGNANHYITIDARGTIANEGAVGARVNIYGAWGVQTREVRVGESYGTINSSMCHFGIGTATDIDSVVVTFPSGTVETVYNPAPDQFITVIENDCVSPTAIISSTQPFVICGSGSVTLDATAGAGYSYLWSTGATTSSISVSTPGEYNVVVTESGNNCPGVSPIVEITVSPDETPTISAAGPTEFCLGESVVLQGSSASNYSWSNGGTTQNITVTQSGTYSLTITGACQNWTSSTIDVVVNAATDPVTTDDNVIGSGSGNLTATGADVTWYDAATGGNIVGTGNNFTTPVVSTTTTYYAENSATFGGGPGNGGELFHPGGNNFSGNTTNATMYFDVNQACILNTVKVYTDNYGDRIIQLYDSGNNLLASQLVTVSTDTAIITLNFSLSPGTGYYLTTDQTENQANFGYISPRLRRSNTGVTYPYNIAGAVSLTTSSAGNGFYYYFYDWNITPITCPSNRIDATVFVTNGIEESEMNGFSVYPNPTNNVLNIQSTSTSTYTVELMDVAGKVVYTNANVSGMKTIDVTTFEAGAYFIRIKNENGTAVQKVIIE